MCLRFPVNVIIFLKLVNIVCNSKEKDYDINMFILETSYMSGEAGLPEVNHGHPLYFKGSEVTTKLVWDWRRGLEFPTIFTGVTNEKTIPHKRTFHFFSMGCKQ